MRKWIEKLVEAGYIEAIRPTGPPTVPPAQVGYVLTLNGHDDPWAFMAVMQSKLMLFLYRVLDGCERGCANARRSPCHATVSSGDPVTIQRVGDALPCPPLCAYVADASASGGVDARRLTETDTLRPLHGERIAGARSDHATLILSSSTERLNH